MQRLNVKFLSLVICLCCNFLSLKGNAKLFDECILMPLFDRVANNPNDSKAIDEIKQIYQNILTPGSDYYLVDNRNLSFLLNNIAMAASSANRTDFLPLLEIKIDQIQRKSQLNADGTPYEYEGAPCLYDNEFPHAPKHPQKWLEVGKCSWNLAYLYNVRGFRQYQKKDYSAASESFKKSLDQCPIYFLAVYNLASVNALQERTKQSIHYLQYYGFFHPKIMKDKAQKDADFDKIRQTSAFKGMIQNNDFSAVLPSIQSSKLNPYILLRLEEAGNLEARKGVLNAWIETGDGWAVQWLQRNRQKINDQYESFMLQAIKKNGKDEYSHYYLGEFYLEKNKKELALKHFEQCKFPSAIIKTAELYEGKNELSKALEHYELYLKSITPADDDSNIEEERNIKTTKVKIESLKKAINTP